MPPNKLTNAFCYFGLLHITNIKKGLHALHGRANPEIPWKINMEKKRGSQGQTIDNLDSSVLKTEPGLECLSKTLQELSRGLGGKGVTQALE